MPRSPFPSRARWPVASLRAYLVLVIVMATVPLALFSLHLVARQAASARVQTAEAVQRTGSSFALLVEHELTSSIDLLTGLAFNDALQRGDIAALYRRLAAGVPMRASWRGVYLAEPDGRVVFASDQPYGSELGRLRDAVALERIRETLLPVVGDVVRVSATGELVTSVLVPVTVRGRLAYVLGARIASSHWQQLAQRAAVPEGGFVSLVDGDGRIVAHSLEPQRAGEQLPVERQAQELAQRDASWRSLPLLEMPSFVQRSTVGGTSWTVGAGVPSAPLVVTQAGTLASLVAAGVLSLLLGVVLAGIVARRVSGPLRQLARGESPRESVVVREIATLQRALREADEQRARARQAAEEANRGKDAFLAMLGHELRNPLGAIAAAVEVLNRSDHASDVAVSARRVIQRQARHMAQLMNDLQDVSRASTGKLALEPRRLDLAQLVWRPLDAMRLAGRFRQHALTIELAPAWTDADPVRIEQVVANLLTNAVKYTPADGTVELTVRRDGDDAVLQVRDSGLGIAPHILPHVFDLFVQGDRTAERRQAGMGIGLTLVRRLIELHGGSVHAHSDGPDRGSTFTVRLPAVAEAAAPRPWQGRRAVIVASEQLPLETATRLADAGCRVTLLSDAATDRVAALRPHVVLVDPARPGAAALAQSLAASGLPPLSVALLASNVPPRGFDVAMAPPIDPARLDECMHPASRPVA